MNGLKMLQARAIQRHREKFPFLPDADRSIHLYNDNTHDELVRAIIAWSHFNGATAVKIYHTERMMIKSKHHSTVFITADDKKLVVEVCILAEPFCSVPPAYPQNKDGYLFVARNFQSFFEWFESTTSVKSL